MDIITFQTWVLICIEVEKLAVWSVIIAILALVTRGLMIYPKNNTDNYGRFLVYSLVMSLISVPFLLFSWNDFIVYQALFLVLIFALMFRRIRIILDMVSTDVANAEIFNNKNKVRKKKLNLEKIHHIIDFMSGSIALIIIVELWRSPYKLASLTLFVILIFLYIFHIAKREERPSADKLFKNTFLPFLGINLILSLSLLLLLVFMLKDYISSVSTILIAFSIVPIFLLIFIQKWTIKDQLENLAENKEITKKTIKAYFMSFWIAVIMTIVFSDIPTFLSVMGKPNFLNWLYGFVIFIVYMLIDAKKEEKIFLIKYPNLE